MLSTINDMDILKEIDIEKIGHHVLVYYVLLYHVLVYHVLVYHAVAHHIIFIWTILHGILAFFYMEQLSLFRRNSLSKSKSKSKSNKNKNKISVNDNDEMDDKMDDDDDEEVVDMMNMRYIHQKYNHQQQPQIDYDKNTGKGNLTPYTPINIDKTEKDIINKYDDPSIDDSHIDDKYDDDNNIDHEDGTAAPESTPPPPLAPLSPPNGGIKVEINRNELKVSNKNKNNKNNNNNDRASHSINQTVIIHGTPHSPFSAHSYHSYHSHHNNENAIIETKQEMIEKEERKKLRQREYKKDKKDNLHKTITTKLRPPKYIKNMSEDDMHHMIDNNNNTDIDRKLSAGTATATSITGNSSSLPMVIPHPYR